MKQKQKITIVTVTYNAQEFLERTIKSVIEQDYENIEYIIIDGGSTDNTINIIKQYEDKIDYWVSEPDDGLYYAMNKGIDVANGDWINFMNAGDYFVNNRIVSSIIYNIDTSLDLIYGNWNNIDSDNNIIEYKISKDLEDMPNGTFCLHQALFVSLKIMRKSKFDIHYKYAAERDFMFKLYKSNIQYKKLDLTICNFLFDDEGFSRNNKTLDAIDALSVISQYTNNIDIIYNNPAYKRLIKQDKSSYILIENSRLILNRIYLTIEDINKEYLNKRVALYGYGTYGKLIKQLLDPSILLTIFDKNYDNNAVFEIKKINLYKFDLLIISVLGKEDEIYKDLITSKYINSNQKVKTLL